MARRFRKFTKKRYWLSALLLAAILIVGGFFIHRHNAAQSTASTAAKANALPIAKKPVDLSPATAADNADNNDRKNSSSSISPTLDSTTPTPGSFYVTVTRADSDGQNLQVAVIVSGITSGSCVLSVSQTGQTTITQTEPVALQVNNYVCPVFNVPLSSLPNTNPWSVSVAVTSANKTVTANWSKNPVALN